MHEHFLQPIWVAARNAQANLPGPPQRLHAARNQNAAPVKFSDWFGLAVAPARLRFALYSSLDGLYMPGTGMSFRRR